MNREDVIQMAKSAGLNTWHAFPPGQVVAEWERFAALVALAEREECAKVCEARFMGDLNREYMEAHRCAAAIRARGNP